MKAPAAISRARLPDVRKQRHYRRLIVGLKRLRVGGGHASLYDVLDRILHELRLDSLEKRAAYMAFNLTVALFPDHHFPVHAHSVHPRSKPERGHPPVSGRFHAARAVRRHCQHHRGHRQHSRTAACFPSGSVTALVLSSNGIMALLDAFEKKYPWFKHRSYLRKRMIATVLTFVLSLILLLAVAGIFFGTYIMDGLVFYEIVPERLTDLVLTLIRYGSLIGLFLSTTCVIYYFVPPVHDKWPLLSAGAVVATLLIFLVSFLFTLYVRIFDSYNHFYGSIGALVGFMVWLEFVCMTLIIGFEVNVSMDAITGRRRQMMREQLGAQRVIGAEK